MTSHHHSWPRGPLEAALLEFRGKEKQWTVEKALLRREADAQRRQAGKLQHQLDKMQVSRFTWKRCISSVFSAHSPGLCLGMHVGVPLVQTVQAFAHTASMNGLQAGTNPVSKHWSSPMTVLAGAAQVQHAGAVRCESSLEEA